MNTPPRRLDRLGALSLSKGCAPPLSRGESSLRSGLRSPLLRGARRVLHRLRGFKIVAKMNENQWFDLCVHLRHLRFNVLAGHLACPPLASCGLVPRGEISGLEKAGAGSERSGAIISAARLAHLPVGGSGHGAERSPRPTFSKVALGSVGRRVPSPPRCRPPQTRRCTPARLAHTFGIAIYHSSRCCKASRFCGSSVLRARSCITERPAICGSRASSLRITFSAMRALKLTAARSQ